MNLVEACKLAKTIEEMKYMVKRILMDENYTSEITENHLRSKAGAGLEDEVRVRETQKEYDLNVEQALKLMDLLMTKKAQLSCAIENAKHDISIDVNGTKLAYDSALEYNKSLRDLIYSVNALNRIKDGSTRKMYERDYTFNVNGDQVEYRYPVEYETKALFDRNLTKKTEKDYRRLADEVSTKIDEAKLNTKIDIDLGIEVNDTLEDVIEKFVK